MKQKQHIKTDYLADKESLKPFYTHSLAEIDPLKIIEQKEYSAHKRQVLCEVLEAQYAGREMHPSQRKNLDLLADPNTYTLTAGHQLNIFGGPMYTPYKVLTVAKLAQLWSSQQPDYQFVPIFWIHVEDHDFEEINHYFSSFNEKNTYPSAFAGATGKHILTDEITAYLPPHFSEELKACYKPGRSLAEATFQFSNLLYGKYGVIVLQADHPKLKSLFIDVAEDELLRGNSAKCINASSEKLNTGGYKTQINARDINLFYQKGNLRNRIIQKNSIYEILDTELKFTQDEILQELKMHPEDFSPNVALRPLYQEVILPNLCYAGGWGELAYWFQFKGMFEHFGEAFPLLLPRMAGTVFSKEILSEWKLLNFESKDILKPLADLFKLYMPNIWQSADYKEFSENLLAAYTQLEAHTAELSQTLPRAVTGQKVKASHFIDNLKTKIHRVIRHHQPAPFNKIEAIKQVVSPDGLQQERVLGLPAFSAEISAEKLLDIFWENCKPLEFEHEVFVY